MKMEGEGGTPSDRAMGYPLALFSKLFQSTNTKKNDLSFVFKGFLWGGVDFHAPTDAPPTHRPARVGDAGRDPL